MKRLFRKYNASCGISDLADIKTMKEGLTGLGRFSNFLRLFGKGFGQDWPGSDTRLRLLEEGITQGDGASKRVDTRTQTPDHRATGSSQYNISDKGQTQVKSTQSSPSSESSMQIGLLTHELPKESYPPETPEFTGEAETPQTILYPTSTRVVLVDDRVLFALTKETIDQLHQLITANRSLEQCQANFRDAKGDAEIGQSFIDNAESQINDAQLPEKFRDKVAQNLKQRRPAIEDDIQRKVDLKRELSLQEAHVAYQRAELDDMFERIMIEAGIIDQPGDDSSVLDSQQNQDVPETNNKDAEGYEREDHEIQEPPEMDDVLPESNKASSDVQNTFNPPESEVDIAQQEHTRAWEDLQLAGQQFEDRENSYKQDLAEHLGTGEYSRTEIDLFHYQLGATLTKNLREAEEEFERTREHCEALGIQVTSSTAGSEIFFDDQDYRESQDPAQDTGRIDCDVIEKWVTQIAGAERPPGEVPPSPSNADTEWDAQSVNMSDSCSTWAHNPKERRLILRYQKQQELLRASVDREADESAE